MKVLQKMGGVLEPHEKNKKVCFDNERKTFRKPTMSSFLTEAYLRIQ